MGLGRLVKVAKKVKPVVGAIKRKGGKAYKFSKSHRWVRVKSPKIVAKYGGAKAALKGLKKGKKVGKGKLKASLKAGRATINKIALQSIIANMADKGTVISTGKLHHLAAKYKIKYSVAKELARKHYKATGKLSKLHLGVFK